MSIEFQYLKTPYGENVLAMLGSEQMLENQSNESGPGNLRKHFHNLMEIAICRMGAGEIVLDEKTYKYTTGDVVVIPRNVSHAIISCAEERSFWETIYVKPAAFFEKVYNKEARKKEEIINDVEGRAFFKVKGTANTLVKEIDLIMDQCRRQERGYQHCINGLLYALYMEITKINHRDYQRPEYDSRTDPKKDETLSVALEYIEENFAKDLRISDIAQATFVSETYLRKLFSDCCAISPMHYVKRIRVENACVMMQNRDISINEVAYKVGYTNMTTFINNFKQITGMSPKQWKQNCRQKRQ